MTQGVQAAALGQTTASRPGDPSAIFGACAASMEAFSRTFSSLSPIAGPALAQVAAALQQSHGGHSRG